MLNLQLEVEYLKNIKSLELKSNHGSLYNHKYFMVGLPNNSYKPITNCLPMISGSLRVLQLLSPLTLVAMI